MSCREENMYKLNKSFLINQSEKAGFYWAAQNPVKMHQLLGRKRFTSLLLWAPIVAAKALKQLLKRGRGGGAN